jgi:hypothetical protein
MMVLALGFGCYVGHKGEGRLEIGEAEGAGEGIIVFDPHGGHF